MDNYYKQIAQIVNEIEISSLGKVFIQSLPLKHDYIISMFEIDKKEQRKKKLTAEIYKYFYSKGSDGDLYSNNPQDYLNILRRANVSKNKIIKGFKVLSVNSDGSVIAENKNLRKLIHSGHFLNISSSNSETKPGNIIQIYSPKEVIDPNDSFFYVLGNTANYNYPQTLVRFYFNLHATSSPLLVRELSDKLNKHKVFFYFKCLKNPNLYNRPDAGVLYLNKYDLSVSWPVIKSIFNILENKLKIAVPLFTLKIYNGIGFAENPPNPNESFGMSRCRLITEGIWQAHEDKLPKSEWTNSVINYIESQGYNLEKFYLNPNSRFPYDFC